MKKTSAKSLWLLTTNKEEVAIIITKVLAVGAVTTETEIKTIMPVQNNNQMETTETEIETTVADKRAERALSKNISLKKAETTKELLQLILRNLMKRISVSRSPSISKPILALT